MRATAFLLLFHARQSHGLWSGDWIRHHRRIGETIRPISGLKSHSGMSETKGYFLLKSEPSEFSITDLENRKGSVEEWDGVRNFAARNILREMKVGDQAFFYHSSCKQPGIVGTVTVSREARPDVTAYSDPSHSGYDPKSTFEKCRWDSVQVRLETIYPVVLTLKELKAQASVDQTIAGMTLLKRGRLSVNRLTHEEWVAVEQMLETKVKDDLTNQNRS